MNNRVRTGFEIYPPRKWATRSTIAFCCIVSGLLWFVIFSLAFGTLPP